MVKFFAAIAVPHTHCIVFNTDSLGKFKAILNVGQYYAYIAKQGYRFEYYNKKRCDDDERIMINHITRS